MKIDADRLVDLMTGIKSLNLAKKGLMTGIKSLNLAKKGPASKTGILYVDLMIPKEKRDKFDYSGDAEETKIRAAGYRIVHNEIMCIDEVQSKGKPSELSVYDGADQYTDTIQSLKGKEVRAECFTSYSDDDKSKDFVVWDELSKYLGLNTLQVVSTKVPMTVNAKLKKIAEDQGTTPSLMLRELLEEKLSAVLRDKALEILYS